MGRLSGNVDQEAAGAEGPKDANVRDPINMRYSTATFVLAFALAGCASVPDVDYLYYPAKSSVVANVTRSVACNSAQTELIVVDAPGVTTSYAADYSKKPFQFRIDALDGIFGSFADTDMHFSFYHDGRLKSINQSSVGQGESVVKSAVSLATTVAALGGGAPNQAAAKPLPICATLKAWGGDKPVSLTYEARVDLTAATGAPIKLVAASDRQALAGALATTSGMPRLALIVSKAVLARAGARWDPSANSNSSGVILLKLQQMVSVEVKIEQNGTPIWDGTVILPASGSYDLPIPKAGLFGTQTFSLTLSEAGAVTDVDYGKHTGATAALNSAGTIATTQTPSTAATQAADEKAKADLIYQTNRNAACQARPASCTAN